MNNSTFGMIFTKSDVPMDRQKFHFPNLNQGELLVKIKYATIWGSDLHTYQGFRLTPVPTILGHEIIGEIAELPTDNILHDYYGNVLKQGDRITWSIAASCGECHYCKIGLSQKCVNLFKYGHEKISDEHPLSGGYAEYCHLAKGTTIVKIPDNIPNKVIGPANCATATTAAAFRVGGDCAGKTVIIQGAGMLGLTACAMASSLGAKKVIALDIDKDRLILASKFGATETILIEGDDADVINEIKNITDAHMGDLIIEMSGISTSVDLGLNLLSIGGHIVFVGSVFTQPNVQINPESIVRGIHNIHGMHNYIPEDLATAITFLEKNHKIFPFEELVSSEFPLQDVDAAFQHSIATKAFRVAIKTD